MRLFARIAAIPLLAAAGCLFMAGAAAVGRPPRFDYPTKLLNVETAYVLGPGGHRQIGLGESGLGFNDRFQITTNTLLDFCLSSTSTRRRP